MNAKYNVIAGLFIGIGLMLLGIFISNGIENFKLMDRSVTVRGLSELEVPADRVIWPITFSEASNDLQTVYRTVEQNNGIIVNFLTSNGIASDQITISAPAVIDRQATSYGDERVTFRYIAQSTVTVSSNKVETVRSLISKQAQLLGKGIVIASESWENRTRYSFTKLNEVKPQMIEDATKNARASAEKFASDSQSKIGKIKTAYQGQFSIDDRDENTPHIKTLRVVTTVEYMLED